MKAGLVTGTRVDTTDIKTDKEIHNNSSYQKASDHLISLALL